MTSAAGKTNADSFAIFAFLWAMAVVFHSAKWSSWLVSPVDFGLAVAAFLVLLQPGSLLRLLLLIAFQLWRTATRLPWVSNHFLFMAFVNLTIIVALVRLALLNRTGAVDRSQLFLAFAPPVRIELLLLYFFSVFSKLNEDWFNPEVSCGAALYENLISRLPFLPASLWAQNAAIYGSLIIEALILGCLVIPRLRMAGLVVAGVFHFILGIGSFFNFSALIFAVLFLFVPENFSTALRAWWSGSPAGRWSDPIVRIACAASARRRASYILFAFGAVVLALAPWSDFNESFVLIREFSTGQRTLISYGFEALWWGYGLVLLAVFIRSMRLWIGEWPGACQLLALPRASFAIVPLLVIANGLSPYVGLKTETSFSMFSNLRTEGSASNHFVVRRGLRLTGHQDDLVTIVDSVDPELQKLADLGYLLPYFELRSYVSGKAAVGVKNYRLSYIRGGVQRTVESAGADPDLYQPHPPLLRKLLYYRPVAREGMSRCQH